MPLVQRNGDLLPMSTKSKYNWKLVFGNPDTDHSYWLDRSSGGISIKDESGELPHQTDDGVLWLDTTKPLYAQKYDGTTYVSIPLFSEEEGCETSSSTSVEKAIKLAERFHMTLVFEDVFPSSYDSAIINAHRKGNDLVISFH